MEAKWCKSLPKVVYEKFSMLYPCQLIHAFPHVITFVLLAEIKISFALYVCNA